MPLREGVNRTLLKQVPPSETKCRNCGKPLVRRIGSGLDLLLEKIDKRRIYYCSNECRAEWYAKTNWAALRDKVLARDNYTCQQCGKTRGDIIGHELRTEFVTGPRIEAVYACMEVHHKIPISDGGAEFDPDNCITLCTKCHGKKTKRRRRFKEADKNQTRLEAYAL